MQLVPDRLSLYTTLKKSETNQSYTPGKLQGIQDICRLVKEQGLQDKIIFCRIAATDVLGISCGGLLFEAPVYTNLLQIKLPDYLIKVSNIDVSREYVEKNGFKCTSIVQTLKDLLDYAQTIGCQELYESLRWYYDQNDQSFISLEVQLTKHQLKLLNLYKEGVLNGLLYERSTKRW